MMEIALGMVIVIIFNNYNGFIAFPVREINKGVFIRQQHRVGWEQGINSQTLALF